MKTKNTKPAKTKKTKPTKAKTKLYLSKQYLKWDNVEMAIYFGPTKVAENPKMELWHSVGALLVYKSLEDLKLDYPKEGYVEILI